MKTTPPLTKAMAKAYRSTNSKGIPTFSFGTSCVAAIIRHVLKDKFPGTKFYVRGDRYSGGSSIDVYFDGAAANAPALKAVNDMVAGYATSGFDGFIDMAYYKARWIMPDGTVAGTVSGGTVDSRGTHDAVNDPMPAGAIMMTGGTDYVFTRDYLPYDIDPNSYGRTSTARMGV